MFKTDLPIFIKKHFIQKYIFTFFLLITFFSKANSEVIARVIKMEGRAQLRRLSNDYFNEEVRPGLPIKNGDAIKVNEKGFCIIMYVDDKSVVKIRENTQFEFLDTQNTRTIELKYGTILNSVNSLKNIKTFRVQTPVSVASVKGTEFAATSMQNGIDQFVCKEGSFEVLNMISGETVLVGPNQKAVSNSSGSLMQSMAAPGDYPNEIQLNENLLQNSQNETDDLSNDQIENNASDKIESKINTEKKDLNPIEPNKETKSEYQNVDDTLDEKKSVEKSEPEAPNKPLSMGLGIGSAVIDGELYNQLAFRPEINLGKIGIGLDLIFYLNNQGKFKLDEWDIKNDPNLLFDKILYIKYGKKIDPFWFKYGSIENMTLGYGGLIYNYSNMMEFPSIRRVGANTGFTIGALSGEIFLSNIKDVSRGGTVNGLRISYTLSNNFPLSIGFNYVLDGNMFSSMKDNDKDSYPDIFDDFPNDSTLWNDTDGDGWPDPGHGINIADSLIDIDANNNNILDSEENFENLGLKATPFSLKDNKATSNGYSFDIGYPIFKNNIFELIIYSEFNSLNFPSISTTDSSFIRSQRDGTGFTIPGLKSILFNTLKLSFEYRILNGSYVPQFFDQAYDLNRVVIQTNNGTTNIKTKDMLIFDKYSDITSSSGFYGAVDLNLFDLANFSLSYADMLADSTRLLNFDIALGLNTDNIPKINSAIAYYQRNNDKDPFDFANPSENTIMGYKIGYNISKGVNLIWNFRQYYRDDGTGNIETIKQTNIETAFNFDI